MDTRNPGNPSFIGLLVLVGIDVVVKGDMPPGRWELLRPGRSCRRWWTAGGAGDVTDDELLDEDEAGCE
jgi:hypothetical protein